MRVIIAGSRSVTDRAHVEHAIKRSGFTIDVVLSGGAKGVDTFGEEWACAQGIPVERYLADWSRYGTNAGPRRNQLMADAADALIAIWIGDSPGTGDMIRRAYKRKLRVSVYIPTSDSDLPLFRKLK
jgi:hypothetical protein